MIQMNIIQHPYIVRVKDNNTILLDDLSETESCISYAKDHNFNVLLIKTSSTSTAAAIAMFLQAGFFMEVREDNEYAPGGIAVTPDIHFLFHIPKETKADK